MIKTLFKIFSRGFKIILSVVLLMVALIGWGLGTQTGLQRITTAAHLFLPGTLSIKEIKGNLFGHLELLQLHYRGNNISLDTDRLVLSWKPGALFKKTLLIDELLLQHVKYTQLTAAETPLPDHSTAAEDDEVFTEINLPITLTINKFLATHIQMETSADNIPDSEPTQINEISLTAQWQHSRLAIEQLQVRLPEYAVKTSGSLQTIADFPHELAAELQISMAGVPPISTAGSIQGTMQQLNIKQRSINRGSESPLLDVGIQLYDVLSDLHWDTEFEIKQFPLELFLPDNKETFDLSGSIQGDLQQLQVRYLTGDVFNGSLKLDGEFVYSPALNWKTELSVRGIDPGLYNPQFPGNIDLHGMLEGKWDNDQLGLHIDLKQLSGTLHELPVSGRGKFTLDGKEMLFEQLILGSGKSRIKINGELAQNYQLHWDLNIPDLKQLLPEGQGTIKAQGKVTGSHSAPVATGTVKINDLAYLQYASQAVQLDFNLDSDVQKQSEITAIAKSLSMDDKHLDSVMLQGKGPLDKHQIKLSAQHEQASLHLAAWGGYQKQKLKESDAEVPFWKGTIEQLNIDINDIGLWKLKTPPILHLSEQKIKLSPLCLTDRLSDLCTRVDLLQGKGKVDIQLKDLSLTRLKPYLPEEITQFDGNLGADIQVNIGRLLTADINADLGSGILTYLADDIHQVRLHHQGGFFKGQLKEKDFNAKFKLSVGEHGAHGNISIPRKNLENDAAKAPLYGDIFLQVNDIGLLTAFVPVIQESEGHIIAQLSLQGVLEDPLISGHATLTSPRALIPVAGIELSNTHFEILGKGGTQLFITGQTDSGDGKINLKGILELDAEQNWPMQMTLTGNDFLAYNLPEAQVRVTPEVELHHGQNGLLIDGKITIPDAAITPRSIPEGSYSVSPDVVIISAENPAPESDDTTAVEARIKVIMGDDVHVKAFGLNAFLAGQMTIHQKPHQLARANGDLKIVSGTYRALGQNLTIENGRLSYAGGHLDNPGLNLRATREVKDEIVGINLSGTLRAPDFTLFSSIPGMSKADISSMLLTGQTVENLEQARFYAERSITPKLSVGVNAGGGDEGSEFVARYKLRRNVHVEATSSAQKSGGRLLYTIEIE